MLIDYLDRDDGSVRHGKARGAIAADVLETDIEVTSGLHDPPERPLDLSGLKHLLALHAISTASSDIRSDKEKINGRGRTS